MSNLVTLRHFSPYELIFNEAETKVILEFIFKSKKKTIAAIAVDNNIRSFAQGLLLEAVDASYALGFVHALFGSVLNPGITVKQVMAKFARKALKHWFKHAKAEDLMDIKIYETVRNNLDWAFGRVLIMYSNSTVMNHRIPAAFVAYRNADNNKQAWG